MWQIKEQQINAVDQSACTYYFHAKAILNLFFWKQSL